MTTLQGSATAVKERPARARKPADLKVAPDPAAAPLAVVPAVAPTPMTMLDAAARRGATTEELKQWMDLQERWEQNEARKAFVKAMTAFKETPLTIRKNKHVRFETSRGVTEYDHVTLENVCRTIIEALSKVGISHRWSMQQESGTIKVSCVLTHSMGHSESTVLEAKPDDSGGKNSIQAIGSTVTYLQRYTLLAATGLAVKEMGDDDGAGAGKRKDPEANPDSKPAYTNEQITKNLPSWKNLVVAGKKTAEQILKNLRLGFTVSEEQEKRITTALASKE
jgi:hypothetical protein